MDTSFPDLFLPQISAFGDSLGLMEDLGDLEWRFPDLPLFSFLRRTGVGPQDAAACLGRFDLGHASCRSALAAENASICGEQKDCVKSGKEKNAEMQNQTQVQL